MKKSGNILVILLLTLSSCGLFRSRVVEKSRKKTETAVHVDSSQATNVSTADKSETVILEKAKGVAFTSASETTVKSDLSSLLSGLKTVRDSGIFRVIQGYDSLKRQINTQIQVRPQSVQYDVDKTTTIKNDIKTDSQSKSSFKRDSTRKDGEDIKNTKATPDRGTIIIVVLVVLVFFVFFVFVFKKGV